MSSPSGDLLGNDLLTAAVEEEGEEEGEEEEEAEDGMEESADEDEDDTAERMDDCGEAPLTPPEGFVYAPCPLLTTEAEQRALIGRKIHPGWCHGLVPGHDPVLRRGCVMEGAGRDSHRALQEEGDGRENSLDGRVACKLAADNYGRGECGGCCLSRSRAEGATRR